jgi:hypothetical protein
MTLTAEALKFLPDGTRLRSLVNDVGLEFNKIYTLDIFPKTYSTLNGMLKELYADKLIELIPDGVGLLSKIKFNRTEFKTQVLSLKEFPYKEFPISYFSLDLESL